MPDASKQVEPVAAKRLPPAAGKGRKKGSVNKMTATIKSAIEAAFEKAGGADYLARMAEEQPVAFMTLLGKVIPSQLVHSNPDGSMGGVTRIVIEAAPVRNDDRQDPAST